MTNRSAVVIWALVACLVGPAVAHGQTPPDPPAASESPAAAQIDPDLRIDLVETDFTLAALPTVLRMPAGKFTFRLTHRFSRPIAAGDAGDFFADLFGFDSSARIGLEVRYGIRPGTQMTFYRTNDRSIQFLGQHEIVRQSESMPLTVHALAAIDGANNFSEDFAASIGAVLARQVGGQAKVYVEPIMVLNARPDAAGAGDDDHTLLLGLGTRLRLGGSSVYVVAEAAPRLAGYDPGVDHVSLAIEKQQGGHVFQLTVSRGLGTSLRQLALGGPAEDDWFIGFNMTRRFF